jgi:hypothetical protein
VWNFGQKNNTELKVSFHSNWLTSGENSLKKWGQNENYNCLKFPQNVGPNENY